KHNRLGPYHPEIFCLHRYRKNILRLTGAAIESCQLTANDNVWIERIGNDVTIFLGGHWLPIAESDLAVVPATFYSDRTAFLLAAVKPIGERVVCANVIQLRGRLVIPRTPCLPAVHRDDGALVRTEKDDVGIVRVDPNILIIVTAGCAAPAIPGFPAVRRFP